jgi:hypothetical protein
VQQGWDEMRDAGYQGNWWEQAELKAKVLRHPRTGVTFVAVHAHVDFICGGPDANLWGLYRVGAGGALEPVQERRLGAMHSVDRILDIEGDGELELIGHSWLRDSILLGTVGGTVIDRLDAQWYGSPC